MAQTQVQSVSQDEALKLIYERVKDGDAFRIKVHRKPSLAAPALHVATYDGAQFEHISNPESWVPRTFGDGEYLFLVAHASSPGTPITSTPLTFRYSGNPPVASPKFHLMKEPGWVGPSELFYPKFEEQVTQQPWAPPTTVSPISSPWTPGGGVQATPGPTFPSMDHDELSRLRTELALERQRSEARERQIAEDRQRQQDQRLMDERFRKLELQAQAPASKPVDVTQVLTAVTSALTPVLAAFLQSSRENKEIMLKLEADRAQRQEKAAEQLLQRQDKTTEMLLTLMKDKGPDPQIAILTAKLEALASKDQGPADQMAKMMEVMGSMVQMNLRTIQTATELTAGQQDHPVIAGIREVGAAIASFAESGLGVKTQVPAPPALGQGQMPSSPSSVSQGPVQGYVAQGPVQAPQPAPPSASSSPPPVPVTQLPHHPIEIIENLIRARQDPVKVVAFLLQALPDPRMQEILATVGNDFDELFKQRLGAWALSDPSNIEYTKILLAEFQKQAMAAGILEPEVLEPEGK